MARVYNSKMSYIDYDLDDDNLYQIPGVLNHPNYYKVEKNIHVIKNFTTQEERDFFINIAESGTEENWDKDKRRWWNKKILYVGDENLNHDHIRNILNRIRDLFGLKRDSYDDERWFLGGMSTVHRMVPGESMFIHSDNPAGTAIDDGKTGLTNHVLFGMCLYHTQFNGGEVFYTNIGVEYKPEAGDLLMHPGSVKYTHGTKPVLPGPNRYISTTFVFDQKAKKLKEQGMVFESMEDGQNVEIEDPIRKYHMK